MTSYMTSSVPRVAQTALDHIFLVAAMLTGSAVRGEAAVLEGIERGGECAKLPAGLLRATIRAALRCEFSAADGTLHLPAELQRVMMLPAELRRPFVLRALAGMSREDCDRFSVWDSDRRAGEAALALAQLRDERPAISDRRDGSRRTAAASLAA